MPPKPSPNRQKNKQPPAITAAQIQAAFNDAVVLHRQGKLDEAGVVYANILRAQPAHAHSLHLLGVLSTQRRQFAQALGYYDRAIAIQPAFAEALTNRGVALKELGRLDDAIASHDLAIAQGRGNATAFFNRGNALMEAGRLAQAVASYDRVIALEPRNAEALFNRGKAQLQLGDPTSALAGFDAATAAAPGYAQAHAMRGNTLLKLERPEEALASYERALAVDPSLVGAWTNRGAAFARLKRWDEAMASYRKAIALAPESADAHANLGNALLDTKQPAAAAVAYGAAVRLLPAKVEAHINLGNAFLSTRRLKEAIACYDEALRLQPDCAEAQWVKSCTLLTGGDLAAGFRLAESRWANEKTGLKQRVFPVPLWLGREPLAGRSILIYAEQGLGDTIQFIRYLPMVAALGARVIAEVPRPLAGLLRTLPGEVQWVLRGDPLPPFDFHCPLMSLPLAFGTELHSVPHPEPYLHADPVKVGKWAARLGARTKPRVGLAWSGSTNYLADRDRSVALATLAPYLPPECDYFSLHNEVRTSDQPALDANPRIRHFGHDTDDFTEAAALCELMDVVVSVDTSLGHLAAALGRPTWTMLAYSPDWRWMLDRADSPWYSSVRLFRQESDSGWPALLERVRDELRALAA